MLAFDIIAPPPACITKDTKSPPTNILVTYLGFMMDADGALTNKTIRP